MPKRTKKRKGSAPKEWLPRHRYKLALGSILILCLFLNLAFFYGPSWVNGSDNYLYTAQGYQFSQGHFKQSGCTIVDCVNYVVSAGVGFFFALIGYSTFAASLFGILCMCLTVVVIYLIGKELHSPLAGLLSGFFYSLFPLVLSQSSNVGDDVPLVLLLSLSVLFLVLALKSKRNQRPYFLLAGFVSAINILVVAEATIGIFMILTFLILVVLFRRSKRLTINGLGFYLLGVVIALFLVALVGIYQTGNPLFVINVYSSNFQGYVTSPAAYSYLRALFSYGPYKNLDTLAYGYFGFIFVLCAAYLAAARFKRGAVLYYWFVFSFLYLGFGSERYTAYSPVQYVVRFSLILVPAITLIIGIAFAKLIQRAGKTRRLALSVPLYALVLLALAVIAFSSISNVIYINYSQLQSSEPLIQFGQYFTALPPNAAISGPADIPWSTYLSQTRDFTALGYSGSQRNCSDLFNTLKPLPGTYLIGNVTDYRSCYLVVVYTPRQIPSLRNYTGFVPWGYNFYRFLIYRYEPPANAPT